MSSTTSGQHAVARSQSLLAKYAMVGLFPFLMVVMIVGVMLTAMHQPAPNHMPLAVVSSTAAQAERAASQLTAATGEAFELRSVGTEAEARELVLKREVVGAYVGPSVRGQGQAVLYVAGAAGTSQTQALTSVLTGFTIAQSVDLQTEDLAPLPPEDGSGVSTLYLTLGWILSGAIFVLVIGTAAPQLMRPRPFVVVSAGWAVFMGFAVWLMIGPIIGAIDGHPELIGLGALASFTGALVTAFFTRLLSPLGKHNAALAQIAAVPAIGLLVILGVPSSGGAVSVWMEPSLFQWLHDILPMPAVLETARSILYFDARTLGGHITTLLIWLFGFLLLNFIPLTRKNSAKATAPDPVTEPTPVSV
ncbi:ABC transporter permease [Actinocorallia sp. A-T 12471]|uniref:ABC transporter permease n=1 Tax=Actinocorallia sp. A-T 12471 TaxID=3089813 RepID=UPI0029D196F4|nr:ABC transporter permease [Actinocorallia sp. A-T 12471]MDX6740057.1 ABC transporter permease [Actinocorallia sp. A-T 12471]